MSDNLKQLAMHALDRAFGIVNRRLEGEIALKAMDKEKRHKELLTKIRNDRQDELNDRNLEQQIAMNDYGEQRKTIKALTNNLQAAGILSDEYLSDIKNSPYFTSAGESLIQDIQSTATDEFYVGLDEVKDTGDSLINLSKAIERQSGIIVGLNQLVDEKIKGEKFANDYYTEATLDWQIDAEEFTDSHIGQAFKEEFTDDYTFLDLDGSISTEIGWNPAYAATLNKLDAVDKVKANAALLELRAKFPQQFYTINVNKLDPNHADYDAELSQEFDAIRQSKVLTDYKSGSDLIRSDANDGVYSKLQLLFRNKRGEDGVLTSGSHNTDTGQYHTLNDYSDYQKYSSNELYKDSDGIASLKKQIMDDFVEIIDRQENNQWSFDIVEALLNDYKGTGHLVGSNAQEQAQSEAKYGRRAGKILMDMVIDSSNPNDIRFNTNAYTGKYYGGAFNEQSGDNNEIGFNPLAQWGDSNGNEYLLKLAEMYHYLENIGTVYSELEGAPEDAIPLALDYLVNSDSGSFPGLTSKYAESVASEAKADLKTWLGKIGYSDYYETYKSVVDEATAKTGGEDTSSADMPYFPTFQFDDGKTQFERTMEIEDLYAGDIRQSVAGITSNYDAIRESQINENYNQQKEEYAEIVQVFLENRDEMESLSQTDTILTNMLEKIKEDETIDARALQDILASLEENERIKFDKALDDKPFNEWTIKDWEDFEESLNLLSSIESNKKG
tara:strand:+ start:537 stop:2714 length:2178 start_codon:yes stop_codon:yes gene_type:complete